MEQIDFKVHPRRGRCWRYVPLQGPTASHRLDGPHVFIGHQLMGISVVPTFRPLHAVLPCTLSSIVKDSLCFGIESAGLRTRPDEGGGCLDLVRQSG